jgi:hypothetical protein
LIVTYLTPKLDCTPEYSIHVKLTHSKSFSTSFFLSIYPSQFSDLHKQTV